MKRLSIKLRVTLWFVLFMTLLVITVLIFLFSTGKYMLANGSRDMLIGIVTDSLSEIEYDNGKLEIDHDLVYFQRGAYISVYNQTGQLIYGRVPPEFTVNPTLYDGQLSTVPDGDHTWYVYDIQYLLGHNDPVWVRGIVSAEEGGHTLNTMLKLAAIALPFLVLLAAIGGYLIINRAFRPVRQITEAAEHIGDSKDLSERIGLDSGKDEIYTLAATFDRMFDRLQAAFNRERQFTSDASHELRTPISVIISQCEYTLANADTVEDTKAALEQILSQSKKMSALVAQLLTLSRADKGQERLHLEPLNISELAELVAAQIREIAAGKKITVETDIEPDLLICADETLLMRLMLNLMENGIKYGKTGGFLSVKLRRENQLIIGDITDNGIGIAPENLPRIWERFFQADDARSSSLEGVGLGLPMVKYIAEAHGGSISVTSTLGMGSTFTFELPCK